MYKRILLSHKFTWIALDELYTTLPALKKSLLSYADDVFCSLEYEERFVEQQRTAEQIYQRCLEQQKTCDAVVWFLHYDTPSRGMEQELLLAKERSQSYFLLKRILDPEPEFFALYTTAAKRILEYSSFEELLDRLKIEGESFFASQALSFTM